MYIWIDSPELPNADCWIHRRAPAYSCADGWTGTANHSCMIDRSNGKCSIPVWLGGNQSRGIKKCWGKTLEKP